MRSKPNIVFFLVDDMGWKDLSCYGSDFYETPNIDKLSKQGRVFKQAYSSSPVCSPARASILTGKYPARVGITDWIDFRNVMHPLEGMLFDAPYKKGLSQNEYTLAEALKDNGYKTWHVGKWHLGGKNHLPLDFGFDVNIGGCEYGSPGSGGYFSPWEIPALKDAKVSRGTYLTDYLTEQAVSLINNHDKKQPFFLNMWYYTVHTPIEAKEEKIKKYKAKAEKMGLNKIMPFEIGGRGTTIDKKNINLKRRIIQSNAEYASMIESLDESIGKLLKTLDDNMLLDDTIIIFTSDNGGLSTAEGAPTCNLPLSEGKGWMYEGGIREPLIIKWNNKIKPQVDNNNYVIGTDFYSTILELVDAKNLKQVPSNDGKSFASLLLRDDKSFFRDDIYWHYPHYGNQGGSPASSIRVGDYKLIYFYEKNEAELYNIKDDLEEKYDIAQANPVIVANLIEKIKEWMVETKAIVPKTNPNFKEWEGRTRGFHTL